MNTHDERLTFLATQTEPPVQQGCHAYRGGFGVPENDTSVPEIHIHAVKSWRADRSDEATLARAVSLEALQKTTCTKAKVIEIPRFRLLRWLKWEAVRWKTQKRGGYRSKGSG